jgi:hypothetical protein
MTKSHHTHYNISDLMRPHTIEAAEISSLRPLSSLKETKFHRGFHRRMLPKADASRNHIIEESWERTEFRHRRAIERARSRHENIINGPLVREQPHSRKRMLGPHTFDDSRKIEAERRISDSSFRFYSPVPDIKRTPTIDPRSASAIIGFYTNPRNRTRSVGVYDNFTHTQLNLDTVPISTPSNRNKSQFTLS